MCQRLWRSCSLSTEYPPRKECIPAPMTLRKRTVKYSCILLGLSFCQILAAKFDLNWSHPARQQSSSSSRVRISCNEFTPHSPQLIPSPGLRLGYSSGAAIHGTDSFRRDRSFRFVQDEVYSRVQLIPAWSSASFVTDSCGAQAIS